MHTSKVDVSTCVKCKHGTIKTLYCLFEQFKWPDNSSTNSVSLGVWPSLQRPMKDRVSVWKNCLKTISYFLFFLGVTGDTEITHSCLINKLSEQSECMQPVQLASLTSWYPIFLAEVKGEVSVKQRRVILVHNVTGCYAPQVTQTPLLRQRKKDSSWETQEQWTKTILAF